MNILFAGNNQLAANILRWLLEQNQNIVALVVHPENKAKHRETITGLAPMVPHFDAPSLKNPDTINQIKAMHIDMMLSILFGYILKPDIISIFPQGVVNLHPSYLPYNRGAYPNVWSIVENTPAGVTLHYIDKGVDTGDIIAQKQVDVLATDTGKSLYDKLELAAFELFKETWFDLKSGHVSRQTQDPQSGTHHRVKDVSNIDAIDLDATFTARELINVIRARTFAPYDGAYFYDASGKKVFMRMELYTKDEDE